MVGFYETDRALGEYLLFHYGKAEEILPFGLGPREALHFPRRCVQEGIDFASLPGMNRALELGCAVGASSFELARFFPEVIGIDLSRSFIEAAQHLAREGTKRYQATVEGKIVMELEAIVPREVNRQRVRFEVGDALHLRPGLGRFSVVMSANLIDRLPQPAQFLNQLCELVEPGGQLVLASPYTWLEEYTAESEWLGGRVEDGLPVRSSQQLRRLLDGKFELIKAQALPFLIREHERKYQWSVAESTTWRRR